MYAHISLSLYIYIYIFLYVYVYGYRERKRESPSPWESWRLDGEAFPRRSENNPRAVFEDPENNPENNPRGVRKIIRVPFFKSRIQRLWTVSGIYYTILYSSTLNGTYTVLPFLQVQNSTSLKGVRKIILVPFFKSRIQWVWTVSGNVRARRHASLKPNRPKRIIRTSD